MPRNSDTRRAPLGLAALAFPLALIPGCGSPSRAYTSTPATARQALDSALSAWQKGAKGEQLSSGSTPIHAVDYQWQTGKVLRKYEILEEQPGEGEAEKRFSVRLTLKQPGGESTVQYVIVGREPIWVFRDVDYGRTSNMSDNPRPKRPKKGR